MSAEPAFPPPPRPPAPPAPATRRVNPATLSGLSRNCAGLRAMAGERGGHPAAELPVLHNYAGIPYAAANCVKLMTIVWRDHRPHWLPALGLSDGDLQTPPARQTAAIVRRLRRRRRAGAITFDMHPIRLAGVLWIDRRGVAHIGVAEPKRHGASVLITAERSGSVIADSETLHSSATLLLFFHPAAGRAAPAQAN